MRINGKLVFGNCDSNYEVYVTGESGVTGTITVTTFDTTAHGDQIVQDAYQFGKNENASRKN